MIYVPRARVEVQSEWEGWKGLKHGSFAATVATVDHQSRTRRKIEPDGRRRAWQSGWLVMAAGPERKTWLRYALGRAGGEQPEFLEGNIFISNYPFAAIRGRNGMVFSCMFRMREWDQYCGAQNYAIKCIKEDIRIFSRVGKVLESETMYNQCFKMLLSMSKKSNKNKILVSVTYSMMIRGDTQTCGVINAFWLFSNQRLALCHDCFLLWSSSSSFGSTTDVGQGLPVPLVGLAFSDLLISPHSRIVYTKRKDILFHNYLNTKTN